MQGLAYADNGDTFQFERTAVFDFERVYGGIQVGPSDVPWMMSLRVGGVPLCGAVFISPIVNVVTGVVDGWDWPNDSNASPEYALTAAHCLRQSGAWIEPRYITVQSGSLGTRAGEGQIQNVVAYEVPGAEDQHGGYLNPHRGLSNDIAVLVLEPIANTQANLETDVKPIEIPPPLTSSIDDLGAIYTSGWGLTEQHHYSSRLLEVLLPLVPREPVPTDFISVVSNSKTTKFAPGFPPASILTAKATAAAHYTTDP